MRVKVDVAPRKAEAQPVPPPGAQCFSGTVAAGLASEVLAQRPDAVAAERRPVPGFYRTEEAKSARLPTEEILTRAASENSRGLELANIRHRVGTIDLSRVQERQLALTTDTSA